MAHYLIKELFYSLQGEGFYSGRPAIFCRFTGCNLWNGLESGRATATCRFCDTDFMGTDGAFGGKYSAQALAKQMRQLWTAEEDSSLFCVLTGGEPALQFDEALRDALHQEGFEIAIETNGTLPLKAQPDWLCVSPKGNNSLRLTEGDELKLIYPQPEHPIDPADFVSLNFAHFYLQPLDEQGKDHRHSVVDYCLTHPRWKLSLQTHKLLNIP
jgi:7-carboxy-7-deazaguanine synthase (Cx14CxxC type)